MSGLSRCWLMGMVLCGSLPSFAGEHAVVSADYLRLRSTPSTDASVRWRLRVNTGVEVLEQRDEWVRVRVQGRPGKHPVQGWTVRRLLGDTTQNQHELLRRRETTTSPNVAIQLLERALAIDGRNRESWEDLKELYVRVGDEDGAERVERHLAGSDPLYFARCSTVRTDTDNGVQTALRAELVARFAGEEFEDLTVGEHGEGLSVKEAKRLMRSIGAATWYRHVEDGFGKRVEPISGTPFVAPYLAPQWNEEGGTAWSGGESMTGDSGEYRIGLGPCRHAGELLTTEPITPMTRQPLSLGETNQVLQEVVDWRGDGTAYGISASRPMADLPWREVEVSIPWEWMNCGEEVERLPTTAYALLNEGEVISSMGGGWGADTDPESVSGSHWFSIDLSSGTHYLGVLEARWSTSAGHSLIVVDPQRSVRSRSVVVCTCASGYARH